MQSVKYLFFVLMFPAMLNAAVSSTAPRDPAGRFSMDKLSVEGDLETEELLGKSSAQFLGPVDVAEFAASDEVVFIGTATFLNNVYIGGDLLADLVGPGPNITDVVLTTSTFVLGPVAINVEDFKQVLSSTNTLRGNRPILILISLKIKNNTAQRRTYSAKLLINGTQFGETITYMLDGNKISGIEAVVTYHSYSPLSPPGPSNFSIQMKSDGDKTTQTLEFSRLTILEI